MNYIYTFILIIIFQFVLSGQNKEEKTGTVSYKSSQNIYVKFSGTDGISEGDTLFVKKNNLYKPAVKVQFISSYSAAGEPLDNIKLEINDIVIALVTAKVQQDPENLNINTRDTSAFPVIDSLIQYARNKNLESIGRYTGKLSVQTVSSFNNFSPGREVQRWRYSFSFNADNISQSGFSFSNYVIFNYNTNNWQKVKNDLFYALKIYDLAVKYDASPNDEIWVGRHLIRRLTNIGSIDGIQYEKKFSSFYAGIIAGSRPDYSDLGFDFNLFEFGGFIGRTDTINNSYMENNISIMQQTNHFKIDRRFIYFQHSNNLIPKLNIFFSSELDLYERVKGEAKNSVSLTGLFLSARVTPERWLSIDLSYDARKNVIYYETFKNFTDSLLDKETRQGLRFGVSIRPLNNIYVGLNAGYRYQKADIKPTRNFSGYLNYSGIPFLEISSSVSYNYLTGSFIDGNIYGISLMKDIPFNNSNISVSLRRSDYKFPFSNMSSVQDNIMVDFSTSLFRNFYLSITWDEIFEKERSDGRIFLGLTTRF